MALIKASNLSVGYRGVAVCDNISFEVEKGDYLCIVGENGSGKSTLVKTILGLIPPVKGKIVKGNELNQNEVGYLPQQSESSAIFPASVEEIVLSGFQGRLSRRFFYSKKEKELADKFIEKMNISNLRKKLFSTLSGGQRQKVLLARAMCACERLLLLDEPVTGLDPLAQKELYREISKVNIEDKTAIVMISHDIENVLEYANKILYIGNEVFYGKKEDFLKSKLGMAFAEENNE
ncbi:MAG: ABC transporter ATP-binding protein [Lachnospiraceae bacterium]|nr:ABC transporter ATP-binding protein [Lachnospiraceae bacterium]